MHSILVVSKLWLFKVWNSGGRTRNYYSTKQYSWNVIMSNKILVRYIMTVEKIIITTYVRSTKFTTPNLNESKLKKH